MPSKLPNVVQAEFFHVTDNSSIDGVLEECAQRIMEGSKIKTVVRFYDRDGGITRHVQELSSADNLFAEHCIAFQESAWLQRQILGYKLLRGIKKRILLREGILPLLTERFAAEVRSKQDVAVELDNWSFRYARLDELHELLESVKASGHAWVFIFSPNRLIAENDSMIVGLI